MENYGTVYCITNTINGKQYIGATSQKVEKRWRQHFYNAETDKKHCSAFQDAINKYGEENFKKEVLITCNLEHLDFYEHKFIDTYNSLFPHGYNLKTGGVFGYKHLEETKEKIGKAHRNKKVSENSRALSSEAGKYRGMSPENRLLLDSALKELNIEKLPMYIVMSIDKRNGRNVPRIEVKVPNKKQKLISKASLTLAEKIRLAINYKDSLTTTVVGSS
jgi:group I intron endonuclease